MPKSHRKPEKTLGIVEIKRKLLKILSFRGLADRQLDRLADLLQSLLQHDLTNSKGYIRLIVAGLDKFCKEREIRSNQSTDTSECPLLFAKVTCCFIQYLLLDNVSIKFYRRILLSWIHFAGSTPNPLEQAFISNFELFKTLLRSVDRYGDYKVQHSALQIILIYVYYAKRKTTFLKKLFPKYYHDTFIEDFERNFDTVSRNVLNEINRSSDNPLVYSIPAQCGSIGDSEVLKVVDQDFWIDFNMLSHSISFLYDGRMFEAIECTTHISMEINTDEMMSVTYERLQDNTLRMMIKAKNNVYFDVTGDVNEISLKFSFETLLDNETVNLIEKTNEINFTSVGSHALYGIVQTLFDCPRKLAVGGQEIVTIADRSASAQNTCASFATATNTQLARTLSDESSHKILAYETSSNTKTTATVVVNDLVDETNEIHVDAENTLMEIDRSIDNAQECPEPMNMKNTNDVLMPMPYSQNVTQEFLQPAANQIKSPAEINEIINEAERDKILLKNIPTTSNKNIVKQTQNESVNGEMTPRRHTRSMGQQPVTAPNSNAKPNKKKPNKTQSNAPLNIEIINDKDMAAKIPSNDQIMIEAKDSNSKQPADETFSIEMNYSSSSSSSKNEPKTRNNKRTNENEMNDTPKKKAPNRNSQQSCGRVGTSDFHPNIFQKPIGCTPKNVETSSTQSSRSSTKRFFIRESMIRSKQHSIKCGRIEQKWILRKFLDKPQATQDGSWKNIPSPQILSPNVSSRSAAATVETENISANAPAEEQENVSTGNGQSAYQEFHKYTENLIESAKEFHYHTFELQAEREKKAIGSLQASIQNLDFSKSAADVITNMKKQNELSESMRKIQQNHIQTEQNTLNAMRNFADKLRANEMDYVTNVDVNMEQLVAEHCAVAKKMLKQHTRPLLQKKFAEYFDSLADSE